MRIGAMKDLKTKAEESICLAYTGGVRHLQHSGGKKNCLQKFKVLSDRGKVRRGGARRKGMLILSEAAGIVHPYDTTSTAYI
jgi:hypothetical protein